MKVGELVGARALVNKYWPMAYYVLEDLGFVKNMGQKARGCPSNYIVLKELPTKRELLKLKKRVHA